ncbi:hypothetical protein EYF80_051136 [Liparis tanakae]|uniref:Uncharacterized protein n=1 Tax=Liparis tanakae TaxID=230148 RepID=A0A4Z2FCS8_9TELE|nr:hypothetical protein EYF80_051136 [Liparis tanakae]
MSASILRAYIAAMCHGRAVAELRQSCGGCRQRPFILAITAAEQVGKLHALSVEEPCLRGTQMARVSHCGLRQWLPPRMLAGLCLNQPIQPAQFDHHN